MKVVQPFATRYQGFPQGFALQLDANFQGLREATEPYSVRSNYTFVEKDTIDSLQVDASLGNRTIVLTTPTGDRRRRIIKTDATANTVTISPSSIGQTINGFALWVLSVQYDYIDVEPTGTNWLIVGSGRLAVRGPGIFTTLDTTGDTTIGGIISVAGTGTNIFQGDVRIQNSAGTARYLHLYNANGSNETLIRDGGGAGISSLEIRPANILVAQFTTAGLAVTGNVTLSGILQLGNAYVAGVVVPTGTIIIKDAAGTSYRVGCAL